jgi:hypothetical protein
MALLKKALRNLSSAIDVLSEREREQLKDLILKGQVGTEDELRGYLSRLISARARQKEKERVKQAERVAAARAQQKREEEGETPAELQASIESDDDPGAIDLESEGDAASGSNEPAKLTGKVIDAKSRKPVAYAKVRVIGTSFNEETETTGVFIWEEMPRGRQITLELTRKEYKSVNLQYKSTVDNEQHIVIKLVPQETKGEKKGKH